MKLIQRGTLVGVVVSAAILASGCGQKAPVAESSGAAASAASQSAATQPVASPQAARQFDGVPFLVTAPGEPVVVEAASATPAVEGTDFEVLGRTEAPGNLPGPTPRVLLDAGEAFGSRYLEITAAEIVGLEDMPSETGLIAADGTFTPRAATLQELPGSNPDGLYFEPLDASALGDWVVWREGSAGSAGAMPTLDSDDWRLVAWNRASDTVTELASSFLTNGTRSAPYGTWDVGPSTDGTRVYYEATMPSGKEWASAVISVPLDSPGQVDVVDWGTTPVADQHRGGVFWVDPDLQTVRHGEVGGTGEAVFAVASEGWTVARLAASEDLLVTTVVGEVEGQVSAWILVWDIEKQQVQALVDTGSDWAAASVSGSVAVWGNGSGSGSSTMYRWDGLTLRSLGEAPGMSLPLVGVADMVVPTVTEEGAVLWRFLRWTK